ncbi:MAG: hypothetical protein AB8B73_10095 [Ekhidna sp.]
MKFYFILLSLIISIGSYSQEVSPFGRLNISIGSEYGSLDYQGNDILYSTGGGIGFEGGLESILGYGLTPYISLGYQLNAAFQVENFNGVKNKSSFTFGRLFATAGLNKLFDVGGEVITHVIFGSGINYSIPTSTSRTENNIELGSTSYDPALGFHIDFKLRINVFDKTYLDTGIRYRHLNFSGTEYTDSNQSSLPVELDDPNASGVELSITFGKKI